MKSFGSLKRARSLPAAAAPHTPNATPTDTMEVYRPSTRVMRGTSSLASSLRLSSSPSDSPSPSPSSSPLSGSPVDSLRPQSTLARYKSTNTAHATSNARDTQKVERSTSVAMRPFVATLVDEDVELEDDPFAFSRDTQPIDEDEEEADPPPRPQLVQTSSVLSIPSASTFHLSGSSRAAADELQFLIDGLHQTNSQVTRAHAANSIIKQIIKQPDTPTEIDGLGIMRAIHGFEGIIEALPSGTDLMKPENEVFASLWSVLSFHASRDPTNASFFTARGIDHLISIAFETSTHQSNGFHLSSANGSCATSDVAVPSVSSVSGGFGRKSKRATAQKAATGRDIIDQIIKQEQERRQQIEQQEGQTNGTDRAFQLHIEAMSQLPYLCLIALSSFSSDLDFSHRLLRSSTFPTGELFQLIIHQLHSATATLRQQQVGTSNSPETPTKAAAKTRRTKRGTANATNGTHMHTSAHSNSSSTPSDSLLLTHHRLNLLLTLLENVTHHSTGDFSYMSQVESSHDGVSANGVQVLFDLIALVEGELDQRHSYDRDDTETNHYNTLHSPPSPKSSSNDSNDDNRIRPTNDIETIKLIFYILRMLVNVTNHNDAGVEAMNANYHTKDNQQVSGLQLIFRLISRVPWRRLAELAGHPDMFNIMSLGVPIIVNALESSKESMRIVADECRVPMLPANVALVPLPSSSSCHPVGDAISARDWICAFWSFLHQQLNQLAEAHTEQNGVVNTDMPAADADEIGRDLTLEDRYADPFAAVAASHGHKANGNGNAAAHTNGATKGTATSEVEAALTARVQAAADQADEELSLGYRTLSSLLSLLVGFFVLASPDSADPPSLADSSSSTPSLSATLLAKCGQTTFAPMLQYIQEFMILQSDSQVLQQEGLETTFGMIEKLKRIDRIEEAKRTLLGGDETSAEPDTSILIHEQHELDSDPPLNTKRPRLESDSDVGIHRSRSPPSATSPVPTATKPITTARTFDQLFATQRK